MIYLDTSFIVSLYTVDRNSTSAAGILQTAGELLLITTPGELETINALELRVFRKEISAQQAENSSNDFAQDLRAGIFQVKALPEAAFDRARQLSRRLTAKLGIRTADLLHVAAALELDATAFYSFDLQQRKMAEAAGLNLNPLP